MGSFTGGQVYTITPETATCSCPDWTDRRARYQQGDPRRMCKHLVRAFSDDSTRFGQALRKYREDFTHYASEGKGFPIYREQRMIQTADQSVECWISPHTPWVNVYIGGERYGFNPDIGRWAHDKEPGNVDALSLAIIDGVG